MHCYHLSRCINYLTNLIAIGFGLRLALEVKQSFYGITYASKLLNTVRKKWNLVIFQLYLYMHRELLCEADPHCSKIYHLLLQVYIDTLLYRIPNTDIRIRPLSYIFYTLCALLVFWLPCTCVLFWLYKHIMCLATHRRMRTIFAIAPTAKSTTAKCSSWRTGGWRRSSRPQSTSATSCAWTTARACRATSCCSPPQTRLASRSSRPQASTARRTWRCARVLSSRVLSTRLVSCHTHITTIQYTTLEYTVL